MFKVAYWEGDHKSEMAKSFREGKKTKRLGLVKTRNWVFSAAPYPPRKFVRLVLVFTSPKSLHVVVW